MLNTFLTYLWKEWRDARGVAIGFALAIPVLLVVLAFALPHKLVTSDVFSSVVALGCFAIALLSIGSDIVPGEARRGRLDFLRRLPANLATPFLAKLVFFTLSLTVWTVYGWLVACLVGAFPTQLDAWMVAGCAAAVAPWVFAVSCWLPRGALALPATGLLLALFGLPFYFMNQAWPYIRPTPGDLIAFMAVLGVGAVVVAGVSFVRGYRFGRGIGAAAWRGLVVTVVLFVPTYAYAGYRVHEWHDLDINDKSFVIRDGWVDVTGRYAYVNTSVLVRGFRGPFHALRIDLRDMEASTAGEDWVHFIDATTGAKFKSGWSHMRWPEVEERLGVDGSVVPEGWRWVWPNGHGYKLWSRVRRAIYDPMRDKVYDRVKHATVLVRRGRWLVRMGYNADWLLYDPDTKESVPAKGLPKRMAHVLLDDGRVLTISRKDAMAVVDPETGERIVVDGDIKDAWPIGTTPSGAPILTIKRPDDSMRIARFDPKTYRLTYIESMPFTNYFYFRLLAVTDEDTVIGVQGKHIVRLQFGSNEYEMLFPNRYRVQSR